MTLLHLLGTLLPLGACAARQSPTQAAAIQAQQQGDVQILPLIRPYPGASKIYVQALLPDGEPGLFLLDTGAGVSAISEETAERLGIVGEDRGGRVTGLSGQAVWLEAELPSLALGELEIQNLDVAVGIPGMPEYTGAMKVDGILGNNVWGRFDLAVDYPGDVVEIGPPGSIEVPRHAQPMSFNGHHAAIQVDLLAGEAGSREKVEQTLILEVDTGARMVLINGPLESELSTVATVGEEPIFGLGASDRVPVSAFYRRTRRIPLLEIGLGGVTVEPTAPATWINYEQGPRMGSAQVVGLAGFDALGQHRVVFDYSQGRFGLETSKHPARSVNGHQILLDQDIARFGDDPTRGLIRARYLIYLDREEEAIQALQQTLDHHDADLSAELLMARLLRLRADPDAYEVIVGPIAAETLVDEGELLSRVNGLLLDARLEDAAEIAQAALAARPEEPIVHLAMADLQLAKGEGFAARASLAKAAQLSGNPDAYLKRRARVALHEGDRMGAVSYLRKQLSYYPSDGEALWFYATLAAQPDLAALQPTFLADLERAMGRLHPEGRPVDFLAAAWRLMGEQDRADALIDDSLPQCQELTSLPSQQNCEAWYLVMAGRGSDKALTLSKASLEAEGPRADFLDTLAMVHLMRGELDEAAAASLQAARLDPDRFYHLWQAERMAEMAQDQAEPDSLTSPAP